jgi:ethanolamine utilization protein EutN
MILARIDGKVTAIRKHPSLTGFRLLIGQRLDAEGRDQGEPQIFIDPIGANLGDRVMVSSDGDLARKLTWDNTTPSRMVVLGLVDETGGAR